MPSVPADRRKSSHETKAIGLLFYVMSNKTIRKLSRHSHVTSDPDFISEGTSKISANQQSLQYLQTQSNAPFSKNINQAMF